MLSRSKHPLAIVSKAMDVLGPCLLVGYDIGCKFSSTISHSSLGEAFSKNNNRTCINAMHGYTHNYACQVANHPNAIDGMGLEDLETLERVFSSSNQVAALTRHSSAYH